MYSLLDLAWRTIRMVASFWFTLQGQLAIWMVKNNILRPKAILKVWRFNDSTSTNDLLAYGVVHLPKTSGFHQIQCEMWTPYGDWKFGALSFYMDSTPRLNNLNILSKDLEKRKKIFSQPAGRVLLEVEIVRKNFAVLNISSWFLNYSYHTQINYSFSISIPRRCKWSIPTPETSRTISGNLIRSCLCSALILGLCFSLWFRSKVYSMKVCANSISSFLEPLSMEICRPEDKALIIYSRSSSLKKNDCSFELPLLIVTNIIIYTGYNQ